MVRTETHGPATPGESVYDLLANFARTARPRLLAVGALLTVAGGLATVLFRLSGWPLAGLCGSALCVCLWGLLEQRLRHRAPRTVAAAEWILVATGTLLAVAAAMAIFLSILGPAPVL
jgi:hypothetical protein